MGGDGAASGIKANGKEYGKKYGSEYHTVLQSGNIKFVKQNAPSSVSSPMETRTSNRVYVTVNHDDKLKYITYYDKKNKRRKQIDLDGVPHLIKGEKTLPHTHEGYYHDENGTRRLTAKERKMVENVTNLWYNYRNK